MQNRMFFLVTPYEIDIDTVYLNDSRSSHFRAVSDSARVYLPILKFSASSLLSAFLDFFMLMVINLFTTNLFFAVLGARIFSFWAQRKFVFYISIRKFPKLTERPNSEFVRQTASLTFICTFYAAVKRRSQA